MSDEKTDARIECTDDALVIHGYYPWAKKIPWATIRGVQRVALSTFRGRGRMWGTANPGLWANFDPSRPGKDVGLIIDLGRRMKPFITPDDPEAVLAAIRRHTGIEPTDGGKSPFV